MINCRTYTIMICSPTDANKYRQICQEVISEWNKKFSLDNKLVFIPQMFEDIFPQANFRQPQEQIDKEITLSADFGIAIFNKKRGAVYPEYKGNNTYPRTYTDHEIETLIKLQKYVFVFYNKKNFKYLKDFIFNVGFVKGVFEKDFKTEIKDLLNHIRDQIRQNNDISNEEIYTNVFQKEIPDLSTAQKEFLIFLQTHNTFTLEELLQNKVYSRQSIKEYINTLVENGIIYKIGSGKNLTYKINDNCIFTFNNGKIIAKPKHPYVKNHTLYL